MEESVEKSDRSEKENKIRIVMSMIRTADILNRYLETELAKLGSNPTRFATMNALFVHGGAMTPTAISKWLFRTKHSITSMLDRLTTIGLVRRERSRKDARSLNIVITDQGWKATKEMIRAAGRISEKSLSCLEEEELETLMTLLRKLRKHLLLILANKETRKS